MQTRARRFALPVLALALSALGACVRPPVAVQLEAPVVQPEPQVAEESTLLEKFRQACQMHEAERNRASALTAQLHETTAARIKAEGEVERLAKQVDALQGKAQELEALKTKFDRVEKSALDLEGTVRDLRREVLEARLANAKQEQTILAFKIEKAKEKRRQVLEPAAAAQTAPPQETVADKGEAVANP